jgi:photosystem II stability/assembly factor-like uncharacterized protein
MQILYDRTNSNIVYAGTDQGVYRSADGGETWEARNMGLGGYGDLVISGIAQDPVDAATLIIGTWGYGVFRSTNSGDSWVRLTDPLTGAQELASTGDVLEQPQVRAGGRSPLILPDPLPIDEQKAAEQAPMPSPSVVPEHPPVSPDGLPTNLPWTPVRRVSINPTNRDEYFACISNGDGLYRSTNAGTTWSKVSLGAGETGSAYAYVFAPSNSQVRYAGFFNGLYRSIDNGSSWTQVGSGTISTTPFAIAIHPTNPNIVMVGTLGGGLYRTINGGGNWSSASGSLSDTSFYSVAFSPSNPTIVYAGGYLAVYTSINTGSSWSNADTSFPSRYVEGLAIDPNQSQTVLVGPNHYPNGGVYKRTSSSDHFALKATGMDDTFVLDIKQDPRDSSILYAGTWGGGVFRSDDGGTSWSSKYGYPYIYSLEATQGITSTILYAATFYTDVGVIKSWDNGDTWHEASHGYSSDISFDLQSINNNSNWLVAATPYGMQYTQDGGLTWYDAAGLTDGVVLSVCQFSSNGPLLAATYGGGLFYSYQGFSWYDTNVGMTGPNSNYTYKVACSPDKPGLAYAGSLGVYRTTDFGEHWLPVTAGLPSDYIRDLDIVPGTGDVLAGTYQNGVYLAPNGSPIWSQINTGLGELRTRAMKVVGTLPYPHAFVGTNGRGAWDYSITSRPAHYTVFIPSVARNTYLFSSANDTYEPNDVQNSAHALSSPGTYDSYIWTDIDADWYRFNVSTLGPVTINLDNIPAGADYDLELYSGSGQLIGGSWWSGNTAEQIQFYPTQTGDYYIKIYGYDKSYSNQKAYRFTVSYNGSPGSGQLYGTVRDNNSLAPGVPLEMDYYNGHRATRLYTLTDNNGNYNLRGAPSLPVGQTYQVAYLNVEDNTSRLLRWYCNPLKSYVAGQSNAACSFNIHDVVATSPDSGETHKPPVSFTWTQRTSTSDSYDLRLHDDNYMAYFESGPLGYVNTYTLYNLPGGFLYGVIYNWEVMVLDSSGFGLPNLPFFITFSMTGAQVSNGSPHTPVDLPTLPGAPVQPGRPALPPFKGGGSVEKR